MSEPTPTPEALQAAIDRALALADSWTSLGEHDQTAALVAAAESLPAPARPQPLPHMNPTKETTDHE